MKRETKCQAAPLIRRFNDVTGRVTGALNCGINSSRNRSQRWLNAAAHARAHARALGSSAVEMKYAANAWPLRGAWDFFSLNTLPFLCSPIGGGKPCLRGKISFHVLRTCANWGIYKRGRKITVFCPARMLGGMWNYVNNERENCTINGGNPLLCKCTFVFSEILYVLCLIYVFFLFVNTADFGGIARYYAEMCVRHGWKFA